jgi:hypothetical protein
MGVSRLPYLLLSVAVLSTACGDSQRDTVTGPEFKPGPPPGACNFGGLPTLVRSYFPGSRQNAIVGLAGSMESAGQFTTVARDYGFQIMDSIGFLSRDASVSSDAPAGATLTVALINCMFSDASDFTYPTGALPDLTKALTKANGGAYYVRGAGRNGLGVAGADFTNPSDTTVLSGVAPPVGGSWSAILAGNAGSEGRALIYGYIVASGPLEFEWATVPSSVEFNPGALVALCDDDNDPRTMVHESSIGVLAYTSGNAICGAPQASAMLGGWGPRALAARLVRVIGNAVRPAPLQATMLTKTGTGGTATTFKSKFRNRPVSAVTFAFKQVDKVIYTSQQPVTVIVRATTSVGGVTTGVNGVCVYVTGSNNNGQGTGLVGPSECDNTPDGGLSAKTQSLTTANGLEAGYATFSLAVTKTGGLVLTASSTDASDVTGVLDRSGQTFADAVAKINVKP